MVHVHSLPFAVLCFGLTDFDMNLWENFHSRMQLIIIYVGIDMSVFGCVNIGRLLRCRSASAIYVIQFRSMGEK